MPTISDAEWDYLSIEERDDFILSLILNQVRYNKEKIPFFKDFYSSYYPDALDTYESWVENTPIITKEILREIQNPFELLNKEILYTKPNQVKVHRGTGGTTGNPFNVFYSKADWKAALIASNRMLQQSFRTLYQYKPLIAFNNYNQGHISGLIFNDQVTMLGGITINRHFKATDEEALQQIIYHQCNLIITPPTSTHKGGSFESLMNVDAMSGAHYLNGENVNCLFFSSTHLTSELYEEIKSLGIDTIFCFYGSTEILPIAISCEKDPFKYHVMDGYIHAAVVNSEKKVISHGERGILLAGRIASLNELDTIGPSECTPLLNYMLGDEVTLSLDACECGRNTRIIHSIERKLYQAEKLSTGCEAWEE